MSSEEEREELEPTKGSNQSPKSTRQNAQIVEHVTPFTRTTPVSVRSHLATC